MGPGADHVGNLDRDVTFYGHWRTAESGEGSPDGGDGFGTPSGRRRSRGRGGRRGLSGGHGAHP